LGGKIKINNLNYNSSQGDKIFLDILKKMGCKIKYGNKFEEVVIDQETGLLKQFYNFMINGKRIELLEGYESRLEENDRVALFPPIGGG